MSVTLSDPEMAPREAALACLADRRRRNLLAVLLDRDSATSQRDLAIRLVAREADKSTTDVGRAEERAVRTDLHHAHLPALETAGLVEWDRDEKTVTLRQPLLEDPAFQRIVETAPDHSDDVLASLANERRRAVLSVLADRDGSPSLPELAEAVLARVTDGEPGPDAAAVRARLHHVHLPKLDDAGLVTYDADAGTVTDETRPELVEEMRAWSDAASVADEPAGESSVDQCQ